MAKLVTTAAERAAASFLDWDDASLGRYCKQMALTMVKCRDKIRRDVKAKTGDGAKAVMAAADGLLLLSQMVEMNAGKLDLRFGDYTHAGKPEGDWRIRVEKVPAKRVRKTSNVRPS